MNPASLFRLVLGRKGWCSNLESIVGAVAGGLAILGIQELGYTLDEWLSMSILGFGVFLGNQVLGNLDIFKRADKALFPELPHQGPGTSDSIDEIAAPDAKDAGK